MLKPHLRLHFFEMNKRMSCESREAQKGLIELFLKVMQCNS